jgi:V/A-type H+-transporting ATPase subunit D
MALKVKLTRPELKRQREALARYERYLPMLKLKQQQLQLAILKVQQERTRAQRELDRARERFERYEAVLRDRAGLDVPALARPARVHTRTVNVAGVNMPVLESLEFVPID